MQSDVYVCFVVYCMSDLCVVSKDEVSPGVGISLLLLKSTQESVRFDVPSRRMNSTYTLRTNAVRRDLGFNPGVFWRRN